MFWRSRARNSEVTDLIRSEFELVRDFRHLLVTSKFDKDPITKKNELAWRHHFPVISLWEIFLDVQGHLTL